MDMAKQAEVLARKAHHGQTDKAGRPYVEHPARVAARVAGDDLCGTVAWLHDVVEDTDVTLDHLREGGFGERVVTAVDAITKRPDESAEQYYDRVRADPIATVVKRADLADNTDPDRLAALDEATRRRLIAKYATATARLNEGV